MMAIRRLGARQILMDRQELSVPPTITADQVKGFKLFTVKAVLSGSGDEVIDLAKVNLMR
jgi:pyruvate dehydrogenase (quinone)